MHCVDLGESFPESIYLQNLASIQPRTSLVKFARSPRTDPPGSLELRDLQEMQLWVFDAQTASHPGTDRLDPDVLGRAGGDAR